MGNKINKGSRNSESHESESSPRLSASLTYSNIYTDSVDSQNNSIIIDGYGKQVHPSGNN
jgi:hypothetical protein